MLQLKNISKKYKTGELVQTALDDVSLNLRDNEFVAVLGPSGSGKTTFLNIIGGLDVYDSGDIVIGNISTKKYNARDWDSYRNHTIGFVFQSYNLLNELTAVENVALPLMFKGIPPEQRLTEAKKMLCRVGLKDRMNHFPNQMSGGQQQRVGIARAFVTRPEVVFADEPTGNLDSKTTKEVMRMIRSFAKRFHQTIVLVSHDPEMTEYADRIVTLIDGEIVSDVLHEVDPALDAGLTAE